MIEGRHSKEENETVIRWDETKEDAFVDSCSPQTYRRMIGRGYLPVSETESFARFRVPKAKLRLPARVRPALGAETEESTVRARKEAHLAKARAALAAKRAASFPLPEAGSAK